MIRLTYSVIRDPVPVNAITRIKSIRDWDVAHCLTLRSKSRYSNIYGDEGQPMTRKKLSIKNKTISRRIFLFTYVIIYRFLCICLYRSPYFKKRSIRLYRNLTSEV